MPNVTPARKLPKKPTPLEPFELNMAAAVRMVDLAEPLANQRSKGIYSSTGERLGDALRLTQAERSEIDVAESDDFYIIIKRGSTLGLRDAESGTRDGFRPLSVARLGRSCRVQTAPAPRRHDHQRSREQVRTARR